METFDLDCLPSETELDAELLRRSLAEFVKKAWPLIEPSKPLSWNWHLDAICAHLQAVTEGRIRRLIINQPPGTAKSSIVSCLWPAWSWCKFPHTRWLFASHKDQLALRDSVRRRRIFSSAWFTDRWPMALSDDVNTKHEFTNGNQGSMMSMGTSGVTGFRGDMLVLDDPNSASDPESELERQTKLDWYDAEWSTRGNKGHAQVIVQQRVHESDITGHVLGRKDADWVHLRLPMEYESGEACSTPIGWKDPRTEDGQLLWPEFYGPKEIAEAKKRGIYYYAGQYQQRPSPRGGGMFKVDVLKRGKKLVGSPYAKLTVRAWDLAATEKKTSKRTAGVLLSKDVEGRYWIEHVVLGKWRPDERNATMKATAQVDGNIQILFEHEGGSSGEDQALAIARLLAGKRVEAVKVTGDKVTRADAVAAQCNLGNVTVIADGTWDHETFLAELETFPNGDYKDQVDALSLAFNFLAVCEVVDAVQDSGMRQVPAEESHWTSRLPGDSNWMSKL